MIIGVGKPPTPGAQVPLAHPQLGTRPRTDHQLRAAATCRSRCRSRVDVRSRTSTALRQLADLGRDPDPSRWGWSIATPDPRGRLRPPTAALRAVGIERRQAVERRGIGHRVGLVVRSDGAGTPLAVDRRGRLTLPTALRHLTERTLVIGADVDRALLVIAPTTALDGLGDLLTGGTR